VSVLSLSLTPEQRDSFGDAHWINACVQALACVVNIVTIIVALKHAREGVFWLACIWTIVFCIDVAWLALVEAEPKEFFSGKAIASSTTKKLTHAFLTS